LDEDVRWIITDEERSAFMQLSNDEERDQFIEAFWQRRDPTPGDTERTNLRKSTTGVSHMPTSQLRGRHPRLEERFVPDVHRVWAGG